jgi:MFS family permease
LFSGYRGLPKEAHYLVWSTITPSVAYGLFYADISYFLTRVQGLSVGFMGLVITLMGISAVLSSIPLGIAADRYGRRKLLITGNVIASLTIAFFALTTNPALLVGAAIMEGVSEAAFSASSSALLADKTAPSKRTSAFSLYSFASSTAFGVGGMAIPLVLIFTFFGFSNRESHILLYVLLAVLSISSTLIILKIKEPKVNRKTEKRGLLPRKSLGVLGKYVLTSAIIAFGAGMVIPLMSLWLNLQYGVSDVVSVFILGVASLVIGVATLAAPPLAKKLGLVKAIVITQSLSTLFMFLTPLSPNYFAASFVYTTRAFLMNMSNPLQQCVIMGVVAEDERGAASGVSAALWRLPNAISTSIGASLMGAGFLAFPFFLASAFYLISIALFWKFFRHVRMPDEKQISPS